MKLPVILTAAVLAASSALAQQTNAVGAPGTDRWTEVEADMVIPPFGKQADLIKNMQVHGPQGGIIGDVEDVVGFGEAQALAVAVDFTGQAGYPDIDDVVVPLSFLTLDETKQFLILAATPAEVLGMEHYED
ncbi:MAG: hypothetical protein KF849_04240 [Rhizobiaceae bacterium]|nr:hypothetical protein [Rhizobiaceae bacterium]